jgi:alkyldihydroxyacetonephosphate synthase
MVVGVDGQKTIAEAEEKEVTEICTNLGGKDMGSELGEAWWKNRYKFYYPPFKPDLPTLHGTTDSIITYDRLMDLYQVKKRVIEEGYKIWRATYTAHFSHWFPWGAMIYDRFFIERPPQDAYEAVELHNRIWADSVRASLKAGGVINEHHGIGHKLGYLMPEQYGPSWDILVRIKKLLDPNKIMNPGKLGFEVSGYTNL